MVEAGSSADPRCTEALDLLEAKRLPDGGGRAEASTIAWWSAPGRGGSLSVGGAVSREAEQPVRHPDAASTCCAPPDGWSSIAQHYPRRLAAKVYNMNRLVASD